PSLASRCVTSSMNRSTPFCPWMTMTPGNGPPPSGRLTYNRIVPSGTFIDSHPIKHLQSALTFTLHFFFDLGGQPEIEEFLRLDIFLYFKRRLDVKLDDVLEPLRRRHAGNAFRQRLREAADAFDDHRTRELPDWELFDRDVGRLLGLLADENQGPHHRAQPALDLARPLGDLFIRREKSRKWIGK